MRRLLAPALLATLGCAQGPPPAAPPATPRDLCANNRGGDMLPRLRGERIDPHSRPLPLDDAGVGDAALRAHVGRAPRRLDVDQFREALERSLGARWTGPRVIYPSSFATGPRMVPDADLVEFYAVSLGRPDYINSTSEVLDPTVTFAKLSTDAARAVCAAAVRLDVTRPPAERTILLEASSSDALPAGEGAIRRNLSALALTLWAADFAPDSGPVTRMLEVFRAGTAEPGATPLDGWRAVCIDLATDPRFWTY